MTRHIVLLGSTGSIGRNALEVIASNQNRFRLIGLAAGENIDLLVKQINYFSPEIISVKHKEDAEKLRAVYAKKKILYGKEGLTEIVSAKKVDTIISAIDGISSLDATLVSIQNNHRLCLANKEILVSAGDLINRELDRSDAELIPIDSEQSAIFQSIGSNSSEFIKRIILTASGGPFFKKNKYDFSSITKKEALAHPTWLMGRKITIDSATLMNKALEVIEASFLFRLKMDQIDVIIHPQSIIHSLVEYIDLSVIAQLSLPDMKIPILYSLSYPERISFKSKSLDLAELKQLDFFNINIEKFESIKMAYYVLENGKNAGAVLNTANEVAVDYFLKDKISFSDIFNIVGKVLYNEKFYSLNTVEDIKITILETKNKTIDYIKRSFNK